MRGSGGRDGSARRARGDTRAHLRAADHREPDACPDRRGVGHAGRALAFTVLVAMAPVSVPRLTEISLDARILGLGWLLTLLTGLGVGLAPALRLSRLSRTSALNRWRGIARRLGRTLGARWCSRRSRGRLCSRPVAGLLLRSLHHLVTQDHGFAPDRLVGRATCIRAQSFSGDIQQLFREMAAESETTAGRQSVAWSMRLPTQVAGVRASVKIAGGIDFAADSSGALSVRRISIRSEFPSRLADGSTTPTPVGHAGGHRQHGLMRPVRWPFPSGRPADDVLHQATRHCGRRRR